MSDHILVCPFDAALIARLPGRALVVRVDDPRDIPRAKELAEKRGRLHCVILEGTLPLAALPVGSELKSIPLAVFTPGVGELAALFGILPILQQLRLRIYLPLSGATTLRDARILSSLGIPSALVWDRADVDWDGLEDLLAYVAFGRQPHASIEPFSHVITGYSTRHLMDFGAMYFDEPARYLHVGSDGGIARTAGDLRAGRFVADIASLPAIPDVDRFQDARERTDHFFLEKNGCASCGGFRVCLGRFPDQQEKSPGCRQLFTKLVDIAETTAVKDPVGLWQP